MQNARLDETQAGIKIARINVNNLRYTDDTTLMAESKEELKDKRNFYQSILIKEQSEKADLKFSIKKVEIMVSGSITSQQIDGKQWQTFFSFF